MRNTLEHLLHLPQDREFLDSFLELAHLLDDVKILSEGLKTIIGKSGITLWVTINDRFLWEKPITFDR
jgi:hypothetical protein